MEQAGSPSTIEIIRRIEQFENSGRPSEYKERWVHSSHWMDSDQRRNILAKAIKQVSFIPDELTIARQLCITRDELQRSYGDLYTIDSYTVGIGINGVRRRREFRKGSNNLRSELVAIRKQCQSPPKPKKRKTQS